jgi:DNA-binding response OmpR family regulator
MKDFQLKNAADGIECLRLLKDGYKPDLIFLDLNIPLKGGLECLRDIHNDLVDVNTAVIIYSTSSNLKDIKAACELGAKFYMVKPTSFETLTAMLKHLLTVMGNVGDGRVSKEQFVITGAKLVAA